MCLYSAVNSKFAYKPQDSRFYTRLCLKGYLCYKMITSQNALFESQVKNFFVS